jgi:peroxiredoxin
MAQIEGKKLDSGALFPKVELKFTDGASIVLPKMTARQWTVLLVYRGRW